MPVNPYSAFDPIPATVALNPPADHFTESYSSFTSDATAVMYQGSGLLSYVSGSSTTTQVVSSTTRAAQYIRQIDVLFTISGFKPNENLTTITFDGIPVTPVAA